MSHDLASGGASEPVLRVEREQPRDDMLEDVPQDRLLPSFIIKHQNIVECRMVFVSLERLDTRTQIVLDNPFGYNDNEHANRDIPLFERTSRKA